MVIGIDGNEANVPHRVGVSVYTLKLLTYFAEKSDNKIKYIVYLRKPPLPGLPAETEYFHYQIVLGPLLWSRIFLPLHLFSHRSIDIFFSPAHYAPAYCPVPIVVTIHDLAHLQYPQDFLSKDLYKLKQWTEKAVKQAKTVIAVSKHTKTDIIDAYHIPSEKIAVIYNGFEKKISTARFKTSFIKKHHLAPHQYILYTGTLQPRKNISALLQAMKIWIQKYPDWKLVLAGKKGWMYQPIFDQIQQLHLEDSVLTPGYVSDEELQELYRNAFCLVHPSLYEGFGITLLEAMSNGCPVLTSFRSSLSEVAGEAALYFDPLHPQEIVDKLSMLHDSSVLRDELIKKGKEQVTHFSWDTCGSQTLEILKDTT